MRQALDQPQDRRRHDLARERPSVAVARQRLEMRMLGLAEPQRTGKRIDGGDRRADGAALLETDVPVDTDAGELGDLLAAQPRGAPPEPCRKPDGLRRQLFAAGPQEVAEFDAAWVGHDVAPAMEGLENTRIIPGLLVPSKAAHMRFTPI